MDLAFEIRGLCWEPTFRQVKASEPPVSPFLATSILLWRTLSACRVETPLDAWWRSNPKLPNKPNLAEPPWESMPLRVKNAAGREGTHVIGRVSATTSSRAGKGTRHRVPRAVGAYSQHVFGY